jgi:hypothetical protein
MTRATILGLLLLGPALLSQGDGKKVECTFSNPQYAGKCVEQATPQKRQTPVQACQPILECLNDVRCVKTYCQSTTVRGGWSLDSPKPDKDKKAARPVSR